MDHCPPLPENLSVSASTLKASRLAVGAFFFMGGALVACWVSRIPAVQAARGLSHGGLGISLLIITLGALVAMPVAGWCATRVGSDRVTRVSAVLTCLGLPLLAAAPDGPLFMLALLGFGMAFGGLDVAMNAQAVAVERLYGRPINSSFHALFSLGGLAGSVAGVPIVAAGVTPLTHFTVGAALLGAATAAFAFPHLLKTAESTASAPADDAGTRSSRPFPRPPRTLVMLGVVAFCVMMGEGAMADWSAVFLRQESRASEAIAAAGFGAFSIAMALGRFTGDRLAARLGPVALVRGSGAVAASGLCCVLAIEAPAAALAGFAAVGLGFATVIPQIFTAAGRTPGLSSAAALSVATTIGYFGFLLGPPLIGFAAEAIGLRCALGIVIVLSLLITALASYVHPTHAAAREPSSGQIPADSTRAS